MPAATPPSHRDLTVALPTCNGARHLAEALRSILIQGGDFDLIVSDDRSEDTTVAIVREVAGDRAQILTNSERLGLAGNWNRCVTLASTPLVTIFHQDDVMRPGHLTAHRDAFARDANLGLVASAAGVIDDSGRPVPESIVGRGGLGDRDLTFAPGESVRAMAIENPLRCSAVSLRARAHTAVGGFDASYRYVVDWDFWLRIGRDWAIAWLARPTVDIRWHLASETHRFATGTTDLDETTRLLDTLFSSVGRAWPDATSLRRLADRRLSRAFLNRSHVALIGGDPQLARTAMRRAFALWPGIVATIARDPRLAAQMAALLVAPRWSARFFGSSKVPGGS
ncbi:MAG: hypothetical protein JWN86_251 [Planctomycetota bacterium]|nr:hypothetical protein [Planctomycetota bacterium]